MNRLLRPLALVLTLKSQPALDVHPVDVALTAPRFSVIVVIADEIIELETCQRILQILRNRLKSFERLKRIIGC